jgi:hypothetical protein
VLDILILFNQEQDIWKWACGYLGVPVATNVAREKILLDTAALDHPYYKRPNAGIKLVRNLIFDFKM